MSEVPCLLVHTGRLVTFVSRMVVSGIPDTLVTVPWYSELRVHNKYVTPFVWSYFTSGNSVATSQAMKAKYVNYQVPDTWYQHR